MTHSGCETGPHVESLPFQKMHNWVTPTQMFWALCPEQEIQDTGGGLGAPIFHPSPGLVLCMTLWWGIGKWEDLVGSFQPAFLDLGPKVLPGQINLCSSLWLPARADNAWHRQEVALCLISLPSSHLHELWKCHWKSNSPLANLIS
jgi:hypothetical protein